MTPTTRMTHFKNGSNSVLGLPVFTDDAGEEFVFHQNQWTHITEVPLERLHTVEVSSGPIKPKRVPTYVISPEVPNLPAFQAPKSHTIPNSGPY
jgi:hypothetical protein